MNKAWILILGIGLVAGCCSKKYTKIETDILDTQLQLSRQLCDYFRQESERKEKIKQETSCETRGHHWMVMWNAPYEPCKYDLKIEGIENVAKGMTVREYNCSLCGLRRMFTWYPKEHKWGDEAMDRKFRDPGIKSWRGKWLESLDRKHEPTFMEPENLIR